jgi:hypothetical protein
MYEPGPNGEYVCFNKGWLFFEIDPWGKARGILNEKIKRREQTRREILADVRL